MSIKSKLLHPRNPHNEAYDFTALSKSTPELAPYVSENAYGNLSIDFSDATAVLLLNKALLLHFYNIEHFSIPKDHLCPPIPGRADYIHYLADLLCDSNGGKLPAGKKIVGLDIGVGANCIYPIIGNRAYGWNFVGVDVEPISLDSAKTIVKKNIDLSDKISFRLQKDSEKIFAGVIHKEDRFDFTMCNPPFHKSAQDAARGTQRKNRNLAKTKLLNFGGQANELWYPGGEISFITKMIKESVRYSKQCFWFSTLVSKKENLDVIYKVLKQVKAYDICTVEMKQGQKISRFVAWTFLDKNLQEKWKEQHYS